ncbi:MAG: polysaccharide biosynthesis protein [Desulfatibacillaceae bacterium]
MWTLIRKRNLWLMVFADALLLVLANCLAYLARFDGVVPDEQLGNFLFVLPWLVGLKLVCLSALGSYRGMWRYTSIGDVVNIVTANGLATVVAIAVILMGFGFQGFSRGIFLIDLALSVLFLTGFRASIRLIFTRHPNGMTGRNRTNAPKTPARRILIIGAGDMGEKVIREIRENRGLNYEIIGLIDDDPQKRGHSIHGIRILGDLEHLDSIAKRKKPDEIVIAIATISAAGMRRIVHRCEATGIPFRTMPGLGEILQDRVSVSKMRRVKYEDLLGRQPVELKVREIGEYLTGRTVLVTGGAGSIGSELCRQICLFKPQKLVILDKNESGLYEVDLNLKHHFPDLDIVPCLCLVQNEKLLVRYFEEHRPEVVFHAAAYKHVPMMEHHPWEAVSNNIEGTHVVLAASHKYKAQRFVLVSTDKAVRPTNVMGASKRFAEMAVQSCARHDGMRCMAVRFGNVVGSIGSVVPLFRAQIERGGPVTVTHPDVTRYFMTIPEACSLILQAGAIGNGGEIFVLKMGTPVRIADMARDMITLHGFKPDEDIEIRFTGLRPGEKLYEELITEDEGVVPTSHKDIMVLDCPHCKKVEDLEFFRKKLGQSAENGAGDEIRRILASLIPEYKPYEAETERLAGDGV